MVQGLRLKVYGYTKKLYMVCHRGYAVKASSQNAFGYHSQFSLGLCCFLINLCKYGIHNL